MNIDGQKLVMVDKGYTFDRLYIGKNGFDIVKIGDSIGYIESSKLKIYEVESEIVEKQMYIIGDCYYYNDKTLTLNKTKITKGTKVVVVEEFKNNISKIKTIYFD